MQCCTFSKWVLLRCPLFSFSKFKAFGHSYSWSCLPCFVPDFLVIPNLPTLCFPPGTSPACIPPLQYFGHLAPLQMQHFRPTLALKSLILLPPTSYLLPLHPHHPFLLLAVILHLFLCLPPLTRLGFFN